MAQALGNSTARQLINDMDDDEIACRANEHRWPLLKPRDTKLPRGMRTIPQRDGCTQIIESCLNGCGRERMTITLPDGAYDTLAVRTYRQGPGGRHTTIPRDLGVTKTDLRAEYFERCRGILAQSAARSAQER